MRKAQQIARNARFVGEVNVNMVIRTVDRAAIRRAFAQVRREIRAAMQIGRD